MPWRSPSDRHAASPKSRRRPCRRCRMRRHAPVSRCEPGKVDQAKPPPRSAGLLGVFYNPGVFCLGPLEKSNRENKNSHCRMPLGPVRTSADVRRADCTHVAQMEDVAMRNFDFTPFSRSSIGFDHLFDLLNNPQIVEDQGGYPPYDIVRTGQDTYRIALAIAGFSPDEITVTSQQNLLTVDGRKANEDDRQYLHRGISARAFTRRFNLEDHVEVERANYENGLLQIDLVRKLPETIKTRRIEIA